MIAEDKTATREVTIFRVARPTPRQKGLEPACLTVATPSSFLSTTAACGPLTTPQGAGPSRLRIFAAWGLSSLPLHCILSLSIYHHPKRCTLCSFILFTALSPYCNVSSRVAEAFRSDLGYCIPGAWESRQEVLSERLLMNQGRKNCSVPTACWALPSVQCCSPGALLPPSVPWNCYGAPVCI